MGNWQPESEAEYAAFDQIGEEFSDPAPRPGLHEELVEAAERVLRDRQPQLNVTYPFDEEAEEVVSTLLPLIEKRLLSDEAVRRAAEYMPVRDGVLPDDAYNWRLGQAHTLLRAALDEALGGGDRD